MSTETQSIRAGDGNSEPFWYAVVSERAPVINKAIKSLEVAEEWADKYRESWPDVEVVPLYRAALAAAPAVSAPAWQTIDPTPEMLEAGRKAVWIQVDDPGEFNLTAEEARAVWLAMLGASPAFQATVTGDAR